MWNVWRLHVLVTCEAGPELLSLVASWHRIICSQGRSSDKTKDNKICHCDIHSLHQVPALVPLYNGHEEDNWWKYNEAKLKFQEHAFLDPYGFCWVCRWLMTQCHIYTNIPWVKAGRDLTQMSNLNCFISPFLGSLNGYDLTLVWERCSSPVSRGQSGLADSRVKPLLSKTSCHFQVLIRLRTFCSGSWYGGC